MKRPRAVRDAGIAIGSALAAAGFAVAGAAVLLDMIGVIRIGFAPTSYDVGKGLDVAHNLVLAAAFALVSFAVAGRIDGRERRLAFAASVAAVSFAAWIAAQALYGVSEPTPQGVYTLVIIDVLGALAATALLAAAVTVAVAFRRAASAPADDQSRRDGLLAWAAGGLGLSLALSTAAAIVHFDNVRLLDNGNRGLHVAALGLAIGVVGALVATIAFVVSRRMQGQTTARWLGPREALIAAALGVFVVGFVFVALGDATVARASEHDDFIPQVMAAGRWLESVSAWILSACAALVGTGFLVSAVSRRSIRTG